MTHTWFKADRAGTYRGRCGEFCGVFHAAMKAVVDVQSQADYTAWLATANSTLGRGEWQGSCAKCHGLQGRGGFGPNISTNALLTQRQGLEQLIRPQLAQANEHFITKQSYNELFTIHGTTMIFLVVVPIFAGFANFLVPLMIGARDVAFPRLNALSYWLFLFGGIVLYLSFFAK